MFQPTYSLYQNTSASYTHLHEEYKQATQIGKRSKTSTMHHNYLLSRLWQQVLKSYILVSLLWMYSSDLHSAMHPAEHLQGWVKKLITPYNTPTGHQFKTRWKAVKYLYPQILYIFLMPSRLTVRCSQSISYIMYCILIVYMT